MIKIKIYDMVIRPASRAGKLLVDFDAGRNTMRSGHEFRLDKLASVGMSVFIPRLTNHPYVMTMARGAVRYANKTLTHKLMFAIVKTNDLIEIVRIK